MGGRLDGELKELWFWLWLGLYVLFRVGVFLEGDGIGGSCGLGGDDGAVALNMEGIRSGVGEDDIRGR